MRCFLLCENHQGAMVKGLLTGRSRAVAASEKIQLASAATARDGHVFDRQE
jgi:hypothetical protein